MNMSFCDDLNMDSKGIVTMVQNFEYLISTDSFVEDKTNFLKKASCGPIILEYIAILTNCVPDPSLLSEAMPTKEDFENLKTPSSFRSSISQIVKEAAQAYKTGNSEMYRIEQSLIDVPDEFINVLKILTQAHENDDYKRSLNRILKKIDNCVTRCKDCASNAYDSFYKVSETLTELHHATMISASFCEKQKTEAMKQKKILEDDHIAHKELESSLKEEFEKAEKNANDARKKYWKQVSGWDVFLKLLGLGGIDCAKDVAKMFISAEAEALSFGTDLAKYGFEKVTEELEKKKKAQVFKKQMNLAKLLEKIAISLNSNTSYTTAAEYVTLLNAYKNVTFGTCEGIGLLQNANECREFLEQNGETLAAEENKTKIED
uniref:Uncharacterized protein n=1 Tax=Panagrolaimus davidi TaxID=227884 RepID=A0A914Q862_9BILA